MFKNIMSAMYNKDTVGLSPCLPVSPMFKNLMKVYSIYADIPNMTMAFDSVRKVDSSQPYLSFYRSLCFSVSIVSMYITDHSMNIYVYIPSINGVL